MLTRLRTRSASGQLDEVTKCIIEQLQQDGRRSYKTIGKVVGLSEGAVRQRVLRLIENKIMQVVAVTDPLEAGFSCQAMIGIHVEGQIESVAASIAQIEEVGYVVVTAGSFDLLIQVVAVNDADLLNVISTRIRAIPGVLSTETFMYLRLAKKSTQGAFRGG